MLTKESAGAIPEALSTRVAGPGRTNPIKLGMWLGLLGFLAFIPTLGNDFVAWDDPDNFIDNIGFRGVGWRNLRWAWTSMIIGVYQPVAWMFLEVQYVFTGLNPYGYHLASALMNGLNTAVLFVLAIELLGRCRPDLLRDHRSTALLSTALATALFGIHPMRTEVVAWASSQPYLPCAFFAMLSTLAYLRANPVGGPMNSRWLLGCFLLYTAAVLSKAAAIPLPAVFVVMDFYPLGRVDDRCLSWLKRLRPILVEKLLFFVLAFVFMVAAVVARVYDRNLDPLGNTGISGRISLTCFSAMFYPVKTLWPFDLHAFYMRPRWEKLFGTQYLVSIAGTITVTVAVIALWKRHPGLLASWVAYLLILAPVSGLVTTGMQVAADRYGYLTMMVWVVPMAVGLADLTLGLSRYRLPNWSRAIPAAAMIVALMSMTFSQCRTWKDSEALWSNGIEHGAGHVADLHNNLGAVWASQGHYELAIFAFNEALQLKPGLKAAQENLDKAIAHLNKQKASAGKKRAKPNA